MTEAADRFLNFHARREAQVKEPMGSLALVLTQWIDVAQSVWGVPGTWAPREDGKSGVVLTAEAADGITVNGELVDGTVSIDGPGGADPATIIFSDSLRGSLIREGDMTGLRVWDANSEWIQNFGAIDAYDYDPDTWNDVIVTRWQQFTGANAVLADTCESFADLKAKRLAA